MSAETRNRKLSILSTTQRKYCFILVYNKTKLEEDLSWRNANMNDECQQFSNREIRIQIIMNQTEPPA